MTTEPWQTDEYFVSPWNYQDEVRKDFTPPARVSVHDVTVRDGEQQAGVVFTSDEKRRLSPREQGAARRAGVQGDRRPGRRSRRGVTARP